MKYCINVKWTWIGRVTAPEIVRNRVVKFQTFGCRSIFKTCTQSRSSPFDENSMSRLQQGRCVVVWPCEQSKHSVFRVCQESMEDIVLPKYLYSSTTSSVSPYDFISGLAASFLQQKRILVFDLFIFVLYPSLGMLLMIVRMSAITAIPSANNRRSISTFSPWIFIPTCISSQTTLNASCTFNCTIIIVLIVINNHTNRRPRRTVRCDTFFEEQIVACVHHDFTNSRFQY